MRENYQGTIGPADAMGALDPEFNDAYAKAADSLLAAVVEFERATGRIVDEIELQKINVTTIHDSVPRHLRHAALNFLPTPGEVDW